MWIKIAIIIVTVIMIYSLISGFYFLIKDRSGSPRLIWSLTGRIVLAILIFGLLIYGLSTGQLSLNAPWLHH